MFFVLLLLCNRSELLKLHMRQQEHKIHIGNLQFTIGKLLILEVYPRERECERENLGKEEKIHSKFKRPLFQSFIHIHYTHIQRSFLRDVGGQVLVIDSWLLISLIYK